jgi:hypothetical protein
MVIIYRSGTIIDNTWLWRADHDIDGAVTELRNPSDTGIIVYGDGVQAYGLMVEHHLKHMTEWHGNDGKVVMYQSEFPYDVDQDYGDNGYASYLVGDEVTSHKAFGVGAYAFFRDHPVIVESAIRVPDHDEVRMINSLSVFLWGQEKSGIRYVISGKGRSVGMHTDRVNWVCAYDRDIYVGEGSNSPDDPPPPAPPTASELNQEEESNEFIQ